MSHLSLLCLCAILILLVVPREVVAVAEQERQVGGDTSLKFRSDGTFRIVFFTDLHFGWTDSLDERTQCKISALAMSLNAYEGCGESREFGLAISPSYHQFTFLHCLIRRKHVN